MAYARFERAIVDRAGNVVPNVWVEVRRETVPGSPKETLKADWFGDAGMDNPAFFADGIAAFHCAGGFFRIHAYAPGYDEVWRYVPIGLGAGTDIQGFLPTGAWDSERPYVISEVVTHPDGDGALHLFASSVNDNLNNEPEVDPPSDSAFWMYAGLAIPGPPGKIDSSNNTVTDIIGITQAAFNALDPPHPTTMYIIITEE